MAKEDYEKWGFGVRLPGDLVEDLDKYAKKESRSRNNIIELLLRAALDAENSS